MGEAAGHAGVLDCNSYQLCNSWSFSVSSGYHQWKNYGRQVLGITLLLGKYYGFLKFLNQKDFYQ